MLERLGALPRRVRWALQRWSAPKDRAFHDALFASQRHDPFTFAYPGYVTIRRFADLADERLGDAKTAIDLGCGPGEITCELARRRPDVAFTGIDHSKAAIARAREHADALALTNIRFVAADISTVAVDPSAGLVMMFDAFHHVLDPAAFVRRVNANRVLLVEPSGDWLGGWQKSLDLDWIAGALDTIRARLAWEVRTVSGSGAPPANRASDDPAPEHGAPTEHRYTMDDFVRFFDGYGLEARGTIAGLETYPRDPYGRPPLAEPFGKLTYGTLVALEELLVSENLDLHAKHWAIYAERGAPHALRTPRPIDPAPGEPPIHLQGAYDVDYVGYEGSRAAGPGATILPSITFKNASWRAWSSTDPTSQVFLSYHWLDGDSVLIVEDGIRTPLPHLVAPDASCTMTCRIETPPKAGQYTLAIDLVEEGVTWFSRSGARLLNVAFVIR